MIEIYRNVLSNLKSVEGVKMIALGGRDGFLFGEHENKDSETLALMAATMIRAAENAAQNIDNMNLNRVIVDFNDGRLIAASVGPKAVISILAEQNANMGHIINELDRTINKVKDII